MWQLLNNLGDWIESKTLGSPSEYKKAVFVEDTEIVVTLYSTNLGNPVWIAC